MPQKQPAATVQRCAPSGMADAAAAVADVGVDEPESGAMERRVLWVKGRRRRARNGGEWKCMVVRFLCGGFWWWDV